jgi:DNA-binding NarL/FixJ family response regulator
MNKLQMISMIAPACAALAIAASVLCLILVRRAQRSAKRALARASELEKTLTAMRGELRQAAQRGIDQTLRLAWLESHLRASELKEEPPLRPASPAKPNVTERRHRVLALARRGLDAPAIATALGVPHGEVELIIGLSQTA